MNAQTKIDVPTAPAVLTAITAVMEQMSKEGIGKDRRNSQQGYNFRGIDDVYNTLCGVLAANKLIILPFVQNMQREERTSSKGGALNYTILTVDFTLASAVDGSEKVVRMIGEAMDSADKSANKAQSAALKYAALQVFMIPTEGDNDADATTHDVVPRQQGQAKADEMPAAEWAQMVNLAKASGTSSDELCRKFEVKNLRTINQQQYAEALDLMNDRLAAKAKAETNQQGGQQNGDAFGLADEIQF